MTAVAMFSLGFLNESLRNLRLNLRSTAAKRINAHSTTTTSTGGKLLLMQITLALRNVNSKPYSQTQGLNSA